MKINLLLIAIFLSIIIFANTEESDGIVGLTLRDGGTGCLCHNLEPNDSVNVWIEGPDSVFVGDTVNYKILMTGGAAVQGGFDLAVFYGTLNNADTTSHIEFGELTHSFPKAFSNDTVSWDFIYIAPDSIVTDTIYSVANSVNGDGNPQVGDNWNFSENFPVEILDIPVSVTEENLLAGFKLEQNYPNPFNPSTKIRFKIPPFSKGVSERSEDGGLATLKVYDILGNEIATLVNEALSPGEYEVEFNGSGLSSGIYLYALQVNGYQAVKKMSLMK